MIKSFNEFNLNESNRTNIVKKGQTVKVQLIYLEGKPESTVQAYDDSDFNDHLQTESFSFLFGGDTMMIASWDGQKWISK